jgi:hypothetical protein
LAFPSKEKTLAPEWGAIIIWLVFLFALLTGVASTFFKEEEARTAMALRLTAEYNAVYWGKTLYNLFISALLGLITIPALVIFAGLHSPDWGLMVMILLPRATGANERPQFTRSANREDGRQIRFTDHFEFSRCDPGIDKRDQWYPAGVKRRTIGPGDKYPDNVCCVCNDYANRRVFLI